MATTSHRTTAHGTLYAVECRECEATGGVRRDGETFGTVAALEDADDVEAATGGHPPADREGPVRCARCGRDRRLSPFVRGRDDDREVIWLCPSCAEQAGGRDD